MTPGFSTPRICFLGNSHLAALRLAASEEPGLLPGRGRGTDWFASSAYTLGGLRLRKGRYFVPYGKRLKAQFVAIAEGKQQIDIRAYDVFVISGVGLEYRDIFALSKSHCLASEAEAGNQAGRALVSEGFFRSYLAGVEAQRPARRLAQEIRSVHSAAQVLLLTAPCPSETILRHANRCKALSRLPVELDAFHRSVGPPPRRRRPGGGGGRRHSRAPGRRDPGRARLHAGDLQQPGRRAAGHAIGQGRRLVCREDDL